MREFQYKKGMKVEVSIEEEGFRGAWFTATIIIPPSKSNSYKAFVQYDSLLSDSKSNNPGFLKEKVDYIQLRPVPPREIDRVFGLDDDVDAFYNDGWWEGVITRVIDDFNYSVYFRPTREQFDFCVSDLRFHREWDNFNWVPPFLQEAPPPPSDMKINVEEVNPLGKGSQVEVTSDEDGFEGAWFAASVIKVLGNDRFLIEYKDLLTDDNKQLMREEVDALYVRPCPPKTEKVDKFKLYEEVDALYNDGWWVGIVSKVVGRTKYKVFFRTTDEEMEFKHEKLRLHQDWINGKWVVASKALNLSH